MVNLGPQWMDPSKFLSDNRQSIYQSVNLNNQGRLSQYQAPQNNSNLWRYNLPAKAGYYTQNEKLPVGVNFRRQMSNIQAWKATSASPCEQRCPRDVKCLPLSEHAITPPHTQYK